MPWPDTVPENTEEEAFDTEYDEPELDENGVPVEKEDEEQAVHRTHGEYQQRETNVAIIGRPNVGKSTLLNALTGSPTAPSSRPLQAQPAMPSTRSSPEYEGTHFRFIDTAGIRRKGKTHADGRKTLGHHESASHLEAADVALLIIDATEGVTSQRRAPSAATRTRAAAASSSSSTSGTWSHLQDQNSTPTARPPV